MEPNSYSSLGRRQQRRRGQGYRKAPPQTRKRVWNQGNRKYSISSILAVQGDSRCLSTSSLSPSLLDREVQTAKSRWSSEVLHQAEPLVKLLKSQLNKLTPSNYDKIFSSVQDAATAEFCEVFCSILLNKASAEQKRVEIKC